MSKFRRSIATVSRKLAIAVAFALFLVLLGMFEGVSYHAQVLECSVETGICFSHPQGTAAMNTTSVVEATFNPILHPFHWIAGYGSWVDKYTSIVSNERGGEVHFGEQYSAQTGERLSGGKQEWVTPEDVFEYADQDGVLGWC